MSEAKTLAFADTFQKAKNCEKPVKSVNGMRKGNKTTFC